MCELDCGLKCASVMGIGAGIDQGVQISRLR